MPPKVKPGYSFIETTLIRENPVRVLFQGEPARQATG
jgi:hypothetical protein